MNTYYEIINNKVLVTNETGYKKEVSNTDKLSEVLINENKLEIIDETIKEYKDVILKNKVSINKIYRKVSILTTTLINLYTIFLVIGNASFIFIFNFGDFIKFLSPIVLIPCLGISCLHFIPKQKEEQNIQINNVIKFLNTEREKTENYLNNLTNQVELKENLKKSYNKKISLEEVILDYIIDIIDKTKAIESEIEEKRQIKTLKLTNRK